MNKNAYNPYIRVGTTYYIKHRKRLLSGDVIEYLVPWSLSTIKQDHGRDYHQIVKEIQKYIGFCNVPDHLNYKRSIDGEYNRYEPLVVCAVEGEFDLILVILKHIFREHMELALDYLTILYQKPMQMLPILCLVSQLRNTGKTTFLNLLKEIFGNNMTFNNNEDFRSNFNSSWVNKLVIAVDEVLLDRKEDSEKLKNLSTARSYKIESKGIDRTEVEFYGKFILCSNNEDDFIYIDPLETRYWIRRIPPLESADPFMLDKLKAQVPAFVYFLKTREIASEKKSRMWFAPEDLVTDALLRIKNRFRNKAESELLEIFSEIMDYYGIEELHFTNKDVIDLLGRNNIRVNRGDVKRNLDKLNLGVQANAFNYTAYRYDSSGILYQFPSKGRYYTITKAEIAKTLMLC